MRKIISNSLLIVFVMSLFLLVLGCTPEEPKCSVFALPVRNLSSTDICSMYVKITDKVYDKEKKESHIEITEGWRYFDVGNCNCLEAKRNNFDLVYFYLVSEDDLLMKEKTGVCREKVIYAAHSEEYSEKVEIVFYSKDKKKKAIDPNFKIDYHTESGYTVTDEMWEDVAE